jgi:phage-related minor tail protein
VNIGDLIFSLIADGSKLEADVQKSAQKAGDAGAKTLGQRLSSGFRTEGVKAFGLAASGVLAIATKGALELEDATARYRAETGATADEAEAAGKAINRTAGDQRVSLQSVTDAAIAVRQNLGLTGAAAATATDDFVEFARVTRQDATGAVHAFDDILDAYGLTADKTRGIQDKLLVSVQKFGGSIVDDQAALAAMAPQLKALNLGLDDGIGLLNLFAVSGLDASAGQKALNQAIAKLPKGETIDQFIKRLSAVKDDGERARLAMEVFGKKAGAGLANAIKPGRDSLDAFKVSQDEANGAVDKGADALDSTFGAFVQKKISQAGAKIREFGASFGPALTGAASLSTLVGTLFPGIGSKLAGGLKGLAGKFAAAIRGAFASSAVSAASTAGGEIVGNLTAKQIEKRLAGKAATGIAQGLIGAGESAAVAGATAGLGATIAAALGAAFAIALPLIFAKVIADGLEAQKKDLSDKVDKFATDATLEGLTKARDAIQKQLDSQTFFGIPIELVNERSGPNSLDNQLKKINDEIARRSGATPGAAGAALGAGEPTVTAGAEKMVSGVPGAVDDAAAEATAAATKLPGEMASGILAEQAKVGDAMDALKNQIANEKTPAQQAAYDIGNLVGKTLAKALRDKRPGVKDAANAVRDTAEAELKKFIANGGHIGKKAMEQLVAAEHSKDPAVRAQAHRTRSIIEQGIIPKSNAAVAAAHNLGTRAVRALKAGWGNPILRASMIIQNSGIGERAVGGPIKAGFPYKVNERTPRSEWIVPSTSGHVLTHADAIKAMASMGGGGNTTYNIPVNVDGVQPVRTVRDIALEMRRLGDLGVLPPRNAPARYPVSK